MNAPSGNNSSLGPADLAGAPASPNGATPNGATPDRASPNGASPNGASPNGATPDEASPNGATPHRRGRRQRAYEWDDPAAAAAAARELDGLSFFRAIMDGRLPAPPIMATLGIRAVSFEPGKAVFKVTPAEYHYNPIGSVHGGVYATICDSACGCAVHTLLPAGAFYSRSTSTPGSSGRSPWRPGGCCARARWTTSAAGPRWRKPGWSTPRGSCSRKRPAIA